MIKLNVLTENDIEAIHESSLRILAETGIVLTHPQGREILAAAGATVESDRVLLPPELVEEAIARCPNEVRFRGRGGMVGTGRWQPSLA